MSTNSPLIFHFHILTINSDNDFLIKAGTVASAAGYPIGSSISSFSFFGLFSKLRRAGPQFKGVDVSVTKPAFCTAANIIPERWLKKTK